MNVTLPVTIGSFSTSFQYLYIYNSSLVGNIPDEISNLSSLLLLSLTRNQLSGSLPETLGNMQELQVLGLQRNKLSGTLPESLCRLQNLALLKLFQNQITGPIPDCIEDLTALRKLNLANNRLSSDIPTSLWQLKDMLYLNISLNLLTGSLPVNIGNLKVVTVVDVSRNQFSGIIPGSIGDLQSVRYLSLAHNRFSGTMPESIGEKLVSLERLYLSHNNLSGVIPSSYGAIQYLRYFDVSFNKLSGRIPSGGPFEYFGRESFVYNEGLCGDPRYGVPLCRSLEVHGSKRRRVIIGAVSGLLGLTLIASVIILATILFVRHRRRKSGKRQVDMSVDTMPLRFSYYDIRNATEGFNESHLIGAGGFSSVYKGAFHNGELLAIKVLNLHLEGARKSFGAECEVLRSLRHRNLCRVIGVCSNESFKALVLEYMPNGSLERWLYSEDCFLDIMNRIDIMIDVACALEYLHQCYSIPVVHCDLKPGNVLLDQDMVARLSDFGISKLLTSDGDAIVRTTTLATPGYIAPEYGSEGLVSTRCDVYSYSIMLMEVFTRKKPSSEAFVGDFSLRKLVYESRLNRIMHIVDPQLLRLGEENFIAKLECLSSLMEVALGCSMESHAERTDMKDVVVKLKNTRLKLLGYLQGNGRRASVNYAHTVTPYNHTLCT